MFAFYAGAVDIATPAPNAVQPNAFTIEELNIISNQAILEGQTLQMRVEEFDEFVLFGSVEWTSSKPDVISCTKNGEIKGLKEGKATITVKAKVGNATDSITVYCARKLNNPKSSRIVNPVAWTCQTPSFLHIQTLHFNIFPLLMTEKLEVKGIFGSYFYVEFERSEKQLKGFILQSWMPSNIVSDEVFRQLSKYDLDVFVGLKKDQYKVTTNYKGTVNWKVSDENIISFDSNTGEVIGKKPGTATISATVGSKTLVCTVHSIYRWPQDWTGAARQATCVYKAKGNTYEETSTQLAVGDTFTVKGDMGGNSSWAYGVSESGTWGYIPINHLSTKGTISQYSSLGWTWPVVTPSGQTTANYISSPYGKRDTTPNMHKGFDITTGVSGGINGYEVVSAFAGEVVYISTNANNSTGYCVGIKSNITDPISGEYMVAFYMHLKYLPSVRLWQKVSAGDLLGYVGNTGNSGGYHLHFEANNKNASIGDGSTARQYYAYLINPLFFYMDKAVRINSNCDAETKYYGSYWYGND